MYEHENINNRLKRDLGIALILIIAYLIVSGVWFLFTGHWLA
jgi:hypothetical protein